MSMRTLEIPWDQVIAVRSGNVRMIFAKLPRRTFDLEVEIYNKNKESLVIERFTVADKFRGVRPGHVLKWLEAHIVITRKGEGNNPNPRDPTSCVAGFQTHC